MPTGYDKLHLFGVCKTVVENGEVHVQNWSFNHDDLGPLQNAINSAIARGWGQGKVKQETCKESHKFKMSGYPFCANGESTVKTRWMIAYLLDELSALGWELHCSADLATHDFDVSSLYFRRGRKSATLGPRAVVSLNKASRLRVYGPQQLKASIQNQMANMGVMQSVDDYAGTLNIKLNFSAWHCNGVATVQARNIILGTIEAAGRAGYELNATLDLMTKMTDKSSFFFTPHPQAQITQTIHYPAAYISLHESDKIRVVGPPELVQHAKAAISKSWFKGISRERMYGNAYEFKLNSHPWIAQGGLTVHTRALVCSLISASISTGWEVVSSADLSQKTTGGDHPIPLDLDTIFLRSFVSVAAIHTHNAASMAPIMAVAVPVAPPAEPIVAGEIPAPAKLQS